MPYTPTGADAEVYKYYCPLCMLYFKNILKGACCGNYLCFACTRDYVASKGIVDLIHNVEDLSLQEILLQEISCPNCFTQGFRPVYVSAGESIRDYSQRDQPGVRYYQPSPVRVGETFEDLKRKMISYQQAANTTTTGAGTGLSLLPTIPSEAGEGIAMLDSDDDHPLQSEFNNNDNNNNDQDNNNDDELDRFVCLSRSASMREALVTSSQLRTESSAQQPDQQGDKEEEEEEDRLSECLYEEEVEGLKETEKERQCNDSIDESTLSLARIGVDEEEEQGRCRYRRDCESVAMDFMDKVWSLAAQQQQQSQQQ
jgi:hypothetical protein